MAEPGRSSSQPLYEPYPARARLLPLKAEAEKNEGNAAYFDLNFMEATKQYTRALRLAPNSALLYANRAAAMLSRGWAGDAAFALRDCDTALRLEPGNTKAMHRRVAALKSLGHVKAAEAAAMAYIEAFPALAEDMLKTREELTAELAGQQAAALKKERDDAAYELRGMMMGRRYMDIISGVYTTEATTSRPGSELAQSSPSNVVIPPLEGPEGVLLSAGFPEANLFNGQQASAVIDDDVGSVHESSSEQSNGMDDGDDAGANEDKADGSPVHPSAPLIALPLEPPLWDCPSGRRLLQRYAGHCNCATDIKEATFLGGDDELVACASDDGRLFIYNSETGEVVRIIRADEDVLNCVQSTLSCLRHDSRANVSLPALFCWHSKKYSNLLLLNDLERTKPDLPDMSSPTVDSLAALAAHPYLPVLATSGIESVVRLWAPTKGPGEEGRGMAEGEEEEDIQTRTQRNQERMGEDPQVLRGVNPSVLLALTENPELLSMLLRRAGREDIGVGMREGDDGGGEASPDLNCRLT